jgi:putative sterol carrier protein
VAGVKFLSDEWLDEMNRLAPPVPQELSIVIEQRVLGRRAYQIVVDGGRLVVGPPATAPDVVLVSDYETAVALARRELSASEAFLAGRIRMRGDLGQLERAARVLAAVVGAIEEMGRVTIYEP